MYTHKLLAICVLYNCKHITVIWTLEAAVREAGEGHAPVIYNTCIIYIYIYIYIYIHVYIYTYIYIYILLLFLFFVLVGAILYYIISYYIISYYSIIIYYSIVYHLCRGEGHAPVRVTSHVLNVCVLARDKYICVFWCIILFLDCSCSSHFSCSCCLLLCLLWPSQHAGLSAGAEVARLRKWHFWCLRDHAILYIYTHMYIYIYIYIYT